MKNIGIALNLVAMLLLHLFCCGLPLVIAFGGTLGLYFSIKAYTNWIVGVYMVSFVWMLLYLYRPRKNFPKNIVLQRVFFWIVTVITMGTYVYTHSNLFKTEEQILNQQYIERILNRKMK